MFDKVENGVTKSCQIFRRKNRKNAQFTAIDQALCRVSRVGSLVWFVRVEIGVNKTSKTKSQKRSYGVRVLARFLFQIELV